MPELSVSVTNLVIVPETQKERKCQCHVVCADWLCSSHELRWKPAVCFLCTELIGQLIGLCKVQHTTQFIAGTVSSAQALKAYVIYLGMSDHWWSSWGVRICVREEGVYRKADRINIVLQTVTTSCKLLLLQNALFVVHLCENYILCCSCLLKVYCCVSYVCYINLKLRLD